MFVWAAALNAPAAGSIRCAGIDRSLLMAATHPSVASCKVAALDIARRMDRGRRSGSGPCYDGAMVIDFSTSRISSWNAEEGGPPGVSDCTCR